MGMALSRKNGWNLFRWFSGRRLSARVFFTGAICFTSLSTQPSFRRVVSRSPVLTCFVCFSTVPSLTEVTLCPAPGWLRGSPPPDGSPRCQTVHAAAEAATHNFRQPVFQLLDLRLRAVDPWLRVVVIQTLNGALCRCSARLSCDSTAIRIRWRRRSRAVCWRAKRSCGCCCCRRWNSWVKRRWRLARK